MPWFDKRVNNKNWYFSNNWNFKYLRTTGLLYSRMFYNNDEKWHVRSWKSCCIFLLPQVFMYKFYKDYATTHTHTTLIISLVFIAFIASVFFNFYLVAFPIFFASFSKPDKKALFHAVISCKNKNFLKHHIFVFK